MDIPINPKTLYANGYSSRSINIVLDPIKEGIHHLVMEEPNLPEVEWMVPLENITESSCLAGVDKWLNRGSAVNRFAGKEYKMVAAKFIARDEYISSAVSEELVIYWGNLKGSDNKYLEVYRDFKPTFSPERIS